jgi:hypothetical protein
MQDKIQEWVARGAYQVSRKYRRIFVPLRPDVCATDMLKARDPKAYASMVARHSWQLEHDAASLLASRAPSEEMPEGGFNTELSEVDFSFFRELVTGSKPWSPAGRTECPCCKTLGHLHAKWCPQQEQPPEPPKTAWVEPLQPRVHSLVLYYLQGTTAKELVEKGIDPLSVTAALMEFTQQDAVDALTRIAHSALREVSRLRLHIAQRHFAGAVGSTAQAHAREEVEKCAHSVRLLEAPKSPLHIPGEEA